MRKMVDLMLGRMAFLLGLLWLSALAAMHFWPASWWLEIASVRVADGTSQISGPGSKTKVTVFYTP